MSTEVSIAYDTSRPKRSRASYRVSFVETDAAPRGLRQVGPVWNNVVSYRGVYATRDEAESAARDYVGDK